MLYCRDSVSFIRCFLLFVSVVCCNTLALSAQPLPLTLFSDKTIDNIEGPELVVLPAGQYLMGCLDQSECYRDEKPRHNVTIADGIAFMTKEVTFAQYNRFVVATGSEKPDDKGWGESHRPVINVSWDDAVAYAEWLSSVTGYHYRLPSEAEWEYAARAGVDTVYHNGSNVESLCLVANVADITQAKEKNSKPLINCDDAVGSKTSVVGSYKPNAFGIYDMHGNVREWVADCYHKNYRGAPIDGSARLDDCSEEERVLRGGSWYSFPWILGASTRESAMPFMASYSIGFRLVRSLKSAEVSGR